MTANISITDAIKRSIRTFQQHGIKPEIVKLNEADAAQFLREAREIAYSPLGLNVALPVQFMGVRVEGLPREQSAGRSIFSGINLSGHLAIKQLYPDNPEHTERQPWTVFDWLAGPASPKA